MFRRRFLIQNGQESAENFSEPFPLSVLPLYSSPRLSIATPWGAPLDWGFQPGVAEKMMLKQFRHFQYRYLERAQPHLLKREGQEPAAASTLATPAQVLQADQKSGSEKGVFWKRGLFRKVHFLEILENLEILEI